MKLPPALTGLRARIVFALGGILFSFAVVASTSLILERRAREIQALEETGRLFARYATDGLYENYASYHIYATGTGKEQFARLTAEMLALNPAILGVRLLGPAGETLYDSRAGEIGIEGPPDTALRQLVTGLAAESATGEAPVLVRRSGRGGETVLEVIRPYSPGGIVMAVAVYDLSISNVDRHLLTTSLAVLAGTVVFFVLLGLALSWIVSRAVLQPVTVLSAAAQALGHGFLDARVDMSGSSAEMKVLADAFRTMAGDLKGNVAKLWALGEEVAAASATVMTTGSEVAEGTSRQAVQTHRTEKALRQMTESSRQASIRAAHVAELGEGVKNSFSEMTLTTEQIAQSTVSLEAYADQTHESIMAINSSVGEVSHSAEALRSLADSSARAITSLHASIQQVRDQAERSRTHSESAHQEATALGSATVEEAAAGMDRLQGIVERAVGIIESLSRRSEEVGHIATLIDEVTDRTNLLGINASIMAAQAGEYGAGFAVVAEEIKSLSVQIAGSTRDIARLLTSMREEASAAVVVIREGSQSAAESVRLSEDVRDVLTRIVDHSAETGRMLAGIAEATDIQGESTHQLKDLAERVAAMARETADATGNQKAESSRIVEATEAVQSLAEQVSHSTQEHTRNARQVADAMRDLGDGVEAIAQAIRRQLDEAEPIGGSLQEIHRLADSNQSRSDNMAETVMALASRADSLRAELSRFRFHGAPATIHPAGTEVDAPPHSGAAASVKMKTVADEEPEREREETR